MLQMFGRFNLPIYKVLIGAREQDENEEHINNNRTKIIHGSSKRFALEAF